MKSLIKSTREIPGGQQVGLVALPLVMACSPKTSTDRASTASGKLDGGSWVLDSLTGYTGEVAHQPFLKFNSAEKTVAGHTGCNSLFGAFQLGDAESLLFGQFAVSEKFCSGANPEAAFLDALKKTNRYRIRGDRMILFQSERQLAVFHRTGQDAPDQKPDGAWELEYITGPKIAFEGLYPNQKPYMNLVTATGKVSGNSSCNSFNGPVTVQGNTIRFGALAATKMACPGEGESVFFKTLESVDLFRIEAGKLILMHQDVTLMRFHLKH